MRPSPTKYCDLVMKGGITSGIVYPNAVLALSKEFRFKNIGGTSAGAIAAAACAAAAMGDRRRHAGKVSGSNVKAGFEGLEKVAGQLATEGFIYSLFQPASGVRNAYRMVVVMAGNASVVRKVLAAILSVVATAPIEFLVALAAMLGVAYWIGGNAGVGAAMLPALLCAYLAGAIFAVLRVARVARRNLLGLCAGRSVKRRFRKSRPGLTDWLHDVLQDLSGKRRSSPLTFDDLWRAERYANEPASHRAINLQMITSGISHNEPRTLPFEDGNLWFRPDEFARLFPPEVVAYLEAKSTCSITLESGTYCQLPAKGALPVIVATRMSLSFPFLISAVPLHEPSKREPAAAPQQTGGEMQAAGEAPNAADQPAPGAVTDPPAPGSKRRRDRITEFRPCWFSDGGISSNFPIHLFDGPLPQWPTFAINLVYPATADTKLPEIYLPKKNSKAWQRKYHSIQSRVAVKEVAGFASAILGTMQNWRDLLQARAPGHRDRIVHISLTGLEGGMNLNMKQGILTKISRKGATAGKELNTFSFKNHYWIRWRNLASSLQDYVMEMADSARNQPRIADYRSAFALTGAAPPGPPSYSFQTQAQREESQKLFERLVEDGEDWRGNGPDLSARAPRPKPCLRIALDF